MGDTAARRNAAYQKGNATIDGVVNAYLDKAIDWSAKTTTGQMYTEDAQPEHRQRDALYLLISKERLYIEALRGLTVEWQGKTASQMPPAILSAMALIQAYEQIVERMGDE